MISKRRFVLAIFLVVLLVALLHLQQKRPHLDSPRTSFVDKALVYVYSPIQVVWFRVKTMVKNSWKEYFMLVDLRKKNRFLEEEIQRQSLLIHSLKARLRMMQEEVSTRKQLSGIGFDGISAKVIGYDPYARSQTIWLSVGSEEGAQVDQPVISTKGLVGRLIKVFPQTSQALLMIDPHFAVDVIDESTRVRALVAGTGTEVELKRYPLLSHVEFLNLGDELRPGDLLITSGLGGLYPSGIPVGNLVEFKKDEEPPMVSSPVLPAVDFSKLEQVMILTGRVKGD